MKDIVFFDTEIDPQSGNVLDIGAIRIGGEQFHDKSAFKFTVFAKNTRYFCGHNVIAHDLHYVDNAVRTASPNYVAIDTLCLSPLLFPMKPYHRLLKDDKLQSDELNNPLNDAIKARDLFYDEINAFEKLPFTLRSIYCGLLNNTPEFSGFFDYLGKSTFGNTEMDIRVEFRGEICRQADIGLIMRKNPIELAYTLALIRAGDKHSVTPPWVMKNYPRMDNVMKLLRGTPCADEGCEYCRRKLNVRIRLKEIFGFDEFRTYAGEPLQERAAAAAVEGKSLLAVFPTGGGKSITFQLPALIAGDTSRGLTVVISPLQSLMKDQVDNLEEKGIVDAVTINGLLDPIERKEAIDRVANGMASILYISPESLRSKTIESLLVSRNVVRFVIDEAHCFSAWGQDFRVDYMYIGDFIRKLREQKHLNHDIPVSCFTATAKQKVISDIQEYFRRKLDLELELFTTQATRQNLHYAVLYKENDDEKYMEMRNLIQAKDCPTIVYVSRVKRTFTLSKRLQEDGFTAQPYNGKMESTEKIRIQDDFIRGNTQIIVATSAFGMGVDKKDVKLVIHYDISDSLENYVQEAGRAGRDTSIDADCYVLFNDEDLDKHFILLNQTKLSISEIQQVWRAIKDLTKHHSSVSCSALEIARQAGWDDTLNEIGTRVTTAIAALENAGYVERGRNMPHVYADSILVPNMMEAVKRLDASQKFTAQQRETAKRVVKFLISRRYTSKATTGEAESRVDYLADRLGIPKEQVIDVVLLMREENILADHMDLAAHIRRTDTQNRSAILLRKFLKLEDFLIDNLPSGKRINYKELNDHAIKKGIKAATVRDIKTIVFYWTICGYLRKNFNADEEHVYLDRACDPDIQRAQKRHRAELSEFIVEYLFGKCEADKDEQDESLVKFSVAELRRAFNNQIALRADPFEAATEDVQKTLLYLSKIQALSIEGGFLVSYNSMQFKRLELDNRIKYKQEDYRQLNEFYKQRMQQIHIVGEYAHLMVKDYNEALQFVSDYFQMDYKGFLAKYFKGNRLGEINRNITPAKYEKLFGRLSPIQREIIDDDFSRHIVVAAGPGSGKTRVLVHKLASLMMLEDVKHEQLLMLTFSRAAATEFKSRLLELIGNAAHFVEIKTFHSYCFDLLGKIGNLEDAANVVQTAAQMIEAGEVEPERITKTVLVIDEAQDMDEHEFALVRALMKLNDEMRVIAVGDDDQNIFEFRGSNSKYMASFIANYQAKRYELLENYRSTRSVIAIANAFAATIAVRMKDAPIQAVSTESGSVILTKYRTCYLEAPLVEQLKAEAAVGSRCILTATNGEALRVMGLLARQGIPAKLIQSNDGFDLYDIAEIRYFIKQLGNIERLPIIDDEVWNRAKKKLCETYSDSTCLPLCLRMLDTFAEVSKKKFRSDFFEFLHESHIEDFINVSGDTVLVSTIHRAKGREFDSVYMMLSNYDFSTDAAKRAVYVGMTRVKTLLRIHTNSDYFDSFDLSSTDYRTDDALYSEPDEIMLQLTHRDVVLDYFKSRKEAVLALRSGDTLLTDGDYLRTSAVSSQRIAKLSQACRERLAGLAQKGYSVYLAQIRFVVAWKGEGNEDETAVVLPELYLRRTNS